MTKERAEAVSYMIAKTCQKDSLADLCEYWDVTIDEFYEFLELALKNAENSKKEEKNNG
jgi:hypothetical protein